MEKITSCELSGVRRAINDPAAVTYSDASLYGYVGDAILELSTKYTCQEFEISGGVINPAPSYAEQSILDLQTKICIMNSNLFSSSLNGGISYSDPVKKIDTTGLSQNISVGINKEEQKLEKLIRSLMMDKVDPVGKPSWQSSTSNEDDSISLNILET